LIAYLDTSAVVPILIDESSTAICRSLWEDADRLVTSRLTYVEMAAALAEAERQNRIRPGGYDAAWAGFTDLFASVHLVEFTPEPAAEAASLARARRLRGYEAVHCAAAAGLRDADLVAASGDSRLLEAWRDLGLAVIDTTS
jgi:predicted nucleic acid-binding protein